ncbi:flagellar hook-associated protein FlgL [Paenisporosarcina quisquiliarum]|uniref:Flagellar hook-associated protein FlgL n=1 Tax=Paenisporosarcina quisquiliarum TaxID=365346 RepID=A0A9X3LI61_9BACL|nr:flagellar hook-associated protein FlgL [Paenisporosarcina quisquiliarum]MCZ8536919.1 flagellar hook-associated protein FlgL [Paenisporosarcina quisquiliarum]
MRVTQQMLHQNSVRHINQNLGRLEKINNQVSTGKQLHRPSDDPNGVSKAMNLKSALVANEQYERNTNEATLWMDETDQTINEMVNVMQRVRELAVQGNNDTLSDTDRGAIATEVEELTEQIRQFANSKVNGKHLFNGLKTNESPYPDKDSYLTDTFDTGSKMFTIADGVVIKANVTANELFGNFADDANLFETLNQLSVGLRSGTDIQLDQIDKGIDRMLTVSAEAGARKNRVESMENRIQDSNIELKSMLSKLEDVNYAEAVTKLKSEESVYQASLAASAKIIQPSLMDFLR